MSYVVKTKSGKQFFIIGCIKLLKNVTVLETFIKSKQESFYACSTYIKRK